MKTLLLALTLIVSQAIKAQNITEKEVFFKNGDVKLSGIILKGNKHSSKGVVIIQGSGNNDRTNQWSYSFAKHLADQGITVLLPDKRGCGKSEGSWKSADFSILAQDAIAGVDYLLAEKSLNLKSVGLLGLSQGGLIVPLAASMSNKINFIIDAVGSATTLEETIIHEMVNTCKKKEMSPASIEDILDLHVRMKNYSLTGNWEPYEIKLSQLNKGELSEFSKDFPIQKNAWIWEWIKLNFSYDPLKFWPKVKVPKLIIYGENDERDNVPVYRSCYLLQNAFASENNLNYNIHIFPKTGHALYKEDVAQIREDVLSTMSSWILSLD